MYNKIVVPVDLAHTDRAEMMIETAKRLADGAAQLILVNVVEEFPPHIVNALPSHYVENSLATAKSELQGIADKAGGDVEGDVRVGHPANAILAAAEAHGADAIVIASHKPALRDYLLGSTAARVVQHAKCSVAVIR